MFSKSLIRIVFILESSFLTNISPEILGTRDIGFAGNKFLFIYSRINQKIGLYQIFCDTFKFIRRLLRGDVILFRFPLKYHVFMPRTLSVNCINKHLRLIYSWAVGVNFLEDKILHKWANLATRHLSGKMEFWMIDSFLCVEILDDSNWMCTIYFYYTVKV